MSARKVLIGALVIGSFLLTGEAYAQQNSAATKQQSAETVLTYDDYMSLGYNASQEGRYYEAAQYFRYALYLNPNDQSATVAYWNARDAIDQDVSTVEFDRHMNAGYDATETGNYEEALSYFEQALEIRPGNAYASQAVRNVRTYLNYDADTLGDPALTDYSSGSGSNLEPALGESAYDRYMRLGYAAQQQEEFVDAANFFRSALYERPEDRWATIAYWNAVDGYQDGEAGLGTETGSEQPYDRYMRLGYDATQRGNYQSAVEFFQQALDLRPNDYYATEAIDNVMTYMNQ